MPHFSHLNIFDLIVVVFVCYMLGTKAQFSGILGFHLYTLIS